ncbi:MAG TPA: tRNA (adenosine(37)-N6)-threonylcarbamoyltransferase complex dimerization subunit type 1 TsaB [Clostridia bacterium]|nr:MAG: tRNA threonylcarbamoyladenosine biosynthesis protein TsaB [Firmicutes bacterium ADurb.Bin248]HOF99493.1 tRNA (adenosine(37)-N6)-threonylcarbamoyltransferase complex dimerization subunit type 1 TsaB [Clostridia bacterium]HOS17913.1 tRNA (adenosine(37)-N6)-threonylcarbamoyltransferase complex dimerization subunit type 1 TsaB [Clostridia bacterium]HPK15186.1 tRNA (adenosine(37)-N6)-threonylcarbamoyltransferase complex dimerization subunit type 1 TsaB [Clostridia bacterium]
MKLLALSTSGRAASAALIEDGRALALAVRDDVLTHSETILPLVDSLFAEDAPFPFEALDAIASDVGPGSFTGVRIGVCVANAFAFAAGKPVVAVSALEALARAAAETGTVCALIDARHGNVYAAIHSGAKALLPPAAPTLAELLPLVPEDALFTGDGALAYRETILAALPQARFADHKLALLTADMLARPAYEALLAGRGETEIRPLYLRPSQAERMYREKL